MDAKKGMLIVLSGPSGVGKNSVLNRIINARQNLRLSISCTTRKPREGEVNGKDYYFLTEEEFMDAVSKGEMLEYAKYCDCYYGTPKMNVEKELELGNNVILEIEVQGGEQIINRYPDALSIFIIPPSMDTLSSRLRNRGLDSIDIVKKRIGESRREIKFAEHYKYIVVNKYVDECASNILKIIDAESMKLERMRYKIEEVLSNA